MDWDDMIFRTTDCIGVRMCEHWECPYKSCVFHDMHDLNTEGEFNNPESCMKYLDI